MKYEVETSNATWVRKFVHGLPVYVLEGTPYTVQSSLSRNWHVCALGKPIDDASFEDLADAKIAAQIRATPRYLRNG